MKAINVDEWFKERDDLEEIGDGVIEQLAKNLARLQDVDIAMTPLVDLLTGYTRYRILQSKIDKAIEYLYEHSQYNDEYGIHYIKEDEYCVDYLLDILKEDK